MVRPQSARLEALHTQQVLVTVGHCALPCAMEADRWHGGLYPRGRQADAKPTLSHAGLDDEDHELVIGVFLSNVRLAHDPQVKCDTLSLEKEQFHRAKVHAMSLELAPLDIDVWLDLKQAAGVT